MWFCNGGFGLSSWWRGLFQCRFCLSLRQSVIRWSMSGHKNSHVRCFESLDGCLFVTDRDIVDSDLAVVTVLLFYPRHVVSTILGCIN